MATTNPRDATPSAKVTVLGGGIAGLAAAIALRLQGRAVDVLEQAPAFREVGAGLQIAPNGGRVLDALGVQISHIASEAVRLIDGPTGRDVLRMPLGLGFRLTHRADLIEALAARAAEVGAGLHLNRKIAGIDGGALIAADGHPVHAGRIVGADGVRGVSRAHVAPDHESAFTGQVAWRAVLTDVDPWPAEAQVHMGPGRHLVLYPLTGGRLNIVAVEEREAWAADGWSATDDPANLRAAFAGFAEPVRALLARVETVHLWGLMDHGATPRWTRDGVTLIGDAAHPTLPFLAQGANLALEDAWTFAASFDDPAGWEAARRPRVARALAAARGNAANYHLSGVKRHAAHAVLRAVGAVRPQAMLARYDWLYDHDVTARNSRAVT